MTTIPKSLLLGMVVLLLISEQNSKLGAPLSSYGLGSAQYLKGDIILYSLFVDTPESKWNEQEKQETLKRLTIATDYMEERAELYHTRVKFIKDWNEDTRLTGGAMVDFSISDGQDYENDLDKQIQRWMRENIDFPALVEAYKAEGYALVIFVNNPGTSYAIVYDGTDNPKESLILFHKEAPAVYAHEILHLFGAHDLYAYAEYTKDVSDYVGQAYPTDIMYSVTDEQGNTYDEEIRNDILPITAYQLGWINYIEEIDIFPQLKRKK